LLADVSLYILINMGSSSNTAAAGSINYTSQAKPSQAPLSGLVKSQY